MSKDLKTIENDLIKYVDTLQLLDVEDKKFLAENKEHLQKVITKTWMWRTEGQKRSIISDQYHPTLHSKFHQSILEQKVQLEEAIRLGKEFELKTLGLQMLGVEIEELESKIESESNDFIKRKDTITMQQKQIEKQYGDYELQQMKVAMIYRMKEVKSWKDLQNEILKAMQDSGMSEKEIWDKEHGETEDMFFLFLNNLQGLSKSTDAGEVNNLIALAKFSVDKAKSLGTFESLKSRCSDKQLEALKFIESIGQNK